MKKLGLVLTGLGAFMLVVALLLKVYAYPALAVAPKDQNSLTVLFGPDATIFDTRSLTEIQTDLTTRVITVGDVAAAEEQDGVVVWLSKTSTRSADGVVRSRDVELAAFDDHTGEAVNCCGEYLEEEEGVQEPVEHQGLLSKFPFDTAAEDLRLLGRHAAPGRADRLRRRGGGRGRHDLQVRADDPADRDRHHRAAGRPAWRGGRRHPDRAADVLQHAHPLGRAQHRRHHRPRGAAEQHHRLRRHRPDHHRPRSTPATTTRRSSSTPTSTASLGMLLEPRQERLPILFLDPRRCC